MPASGVLTLRGWKGYNLAISLSPVTFLVGPNGSGKSSLLEAFALISHLARRNSLQDDLRPWLRGWPDGVFTRSGEGRPVQEISIEMQWGKGHYKLVLMNPQRPEIHHESMIVGQHKFIETVSKGNRRTRKFYGLGPGKPLETDDPYESALALISRSRKKCGSARALVELLSAMEVYALDADFLRGTAVDTRPIPYQRKGTSLVAGLLDADRLPSMKKNLLAALHAIQPDLAGFRTTAKPRGAVLLYSDGREVDLDEESDGLVRAAGMFLVRYRPDCPSILAFDEPENGYHLSRLVEVVTRLAPSPRAGDQGPRLVLLATHSPAFVERAVRALRGDVGVVSLWRAAGGEVLASQWSGEELLEKVGLEAMVAQAFEGR